MLSSKNVKTVADPNDQYEALLPSWKRARAICGGEAAVKKFDSILDVATFKNLLIPFSPKMNWRQYNFYKAEAEFPGIVAEFSRMLVGGLLRKEPTLTFSENVPKNIAEEALDWISGTFNQDDTPLMSFLDEILFEEVQTSRSWVYVDYPKIENWDVLSTEDFKNIKPYPLIWQAESVINWQPGFDKYGKVCLKRVVTRTAIQEYDDENVHPVDKTEIRVHELDEEGLYRIRVYKSVELQNPIEGGKKVAGNRKISVELVDTIDNILMGGKRLEFIPAWPLNGQVEPTVPFLSALVDKEVHVYNKMSRRNHLLYGAATYTPYVKGDISEPDFDLIVNKGLGTWIRLPGEKSDIGVLQTPTEALADYETAIAKGLEEMARLGVRILAPENDQSGIALEIRNAAQNVRLASLNTRVSSTMSQVIAFMVNWRYGLSITEADVLFKLSEDFNPVPLGADWLRLATEWYESGKIPRSSWVNMVKHNDMLPADYDDEAGKQEIMQDADAVMKQQEAMGGEFGDQMKKELNA